MNKLIALSAILILTASCDKDEIETPAEIVCIEDCTVGNKEYYSDYFVFVSDDGGSELVVPVDFNWSPTLTGYEKEFKSWYGTDNEWPISYQKVDIESCACDIPQEIWQHDNDQNLQMNEATREVTSCVDNYPPVKISLPEEIDWIQMPSAQGEKEIYGFRTSAEVQGATRDGWIIYERIRVDASSGFGGDFTAFYWVPIVINGDFYYFQQHGSDKSASRWINGSSVADTNSNFTISILSTTQDATSGRNNIPQELHITSSDWGVDIILESTGAQVGYGQSFPNGLAYYRQSMLKSTAASSTAGHGMFELILEDD
ncbi:MAG: hypothetical protein AB8B56_02350 [Crocinitomicaceae bacterium]